MIDDRRGLIVSATDLLGYLACEHLTVLSRAAAHGEREKPTERDPELEVIAARGLEHERAYLASLETNGVPVARIDVDGRTREDLRRMELDTVRALRDGASVVYQA